ncbi:hypothetical protein GGI43DRAFT_386420 [Trichoderma evansii]
MDLEIDNDRPIIRLQSNRYSMWASAIVQGIACTNVTFAIITSNRARGDESSLRSPNVTAEEPENSSSLMPAAGHELLYNVAIGPL